jgi:hypothetical protein
MTSEEEGVFAVVFILLNLIEPILGFPTILSYVGYLSYTPTTNVTAATAQLTNQVTGAVIALPSVILNEVIDGILSGIVGVLFAMFRNLSEGGERSGGGRTVSFSDGRTVTFRHK